jgi:hypothetical protein
MVVSQRRGDIQQTVRMAVFRNQDTEPLIVCQSESTDACFISTETLSIGDELLLAIQC